MTTHTGTDPAAQLIAHLTGQLDADRDWAPALSNLAAGQVSLHLAVLFEPFLGLLLDGTKTIESRFSRVRCAPYGCLAEGDVIAVKKTGGPVHGAFIAGPVTSHQLTPTRITGLREAFAPQMCATDDQFWEQRADCTYATAAIGIARAHRRDHLPADPGHHEELHPVELDLPAVQGWADLVLPTTDTAPHQLIDRIIDHLPAYPGRHPGDRCA